MNKILLVNFGAFGDILNSTPIAKHYKLADSECHISWMTRKKYASAVKNNPYIDKILTPKEEHLKINPKSANYNVEMTFTLMNEIKQLNEYNKIFFLAPYVWSLTNNKFDLHKDSLLKIIKTNLTDINDYLCEFIPVVKLTEEEEEEANSFYNSLSGNKKILIEHENYSNQTPFNESYIESLCETINEKNFDLIFTGKSEPDFVNTFKQKYKINFYTYTGSFMSNARLYNLCDYFIGCCSGLTCLTHSDYCDTSKTRIEVSKGYHWSSTDWTHMKNKDICFSFDNFKESLKKIC